MEICFIQRDGILLVKRSDFPNIHRRRNPGTSGRPEGLSFAFVTPILIADKLFCLHGNGGVIKRVQSLEESKVRNENSKILLIPML